MAVRYDFSVQVFLDEGKVDLEKLEADIFRSVAQSGAEVKSVSVKEGIDAHRASSSFINRLLRR
jgi:methylmalonyl-CoA mutase cobalamin-binding subunit